MTTLRFAGQDYDAQALSKMATQGHRISLARNAIKTVTVDSNSALRSFGVAVVVHHENEHWLLLGQLPASESVQVCLVSKPLLKKALRQSGGYEERRERQIANRGLSMDDWRNRRY